jgi:hypothetical protein
MASREIFHVHYTTAGLESAQFGEDEGVRAGKSLNRPIGPLLKSALQ